LDDWPLDIEPCDIESWDIESWDIESWDIAWVDDILSWSLCAFAPEVIDPFESDPLDMSCVLCPLDIEPALEDWAAA
jgi:hypothetical protein